jgi:integrase/recombinase XerD
MHLRLLPYPLAQKLGFYAKKPMILHHLETTRYPWRDRVMFLLSLKAGLRAKEIAALTWGMVTDAEGRLSDTLRLQNRATKGKADGRSIPLHPDLQAALAALQTWRGEVAAQEYAVIFSGRGRGLSAAAAQLWFHRLYTSLGLAGCSSHSGRRTFITWAVRRVSEVGAVCGTCSSSPAY